MKEQFTYTTAEVRSLRLIIIVVSLSITIFCAASLVVSGIGRSILDSDGTVAEPGKREQIASILRIVHVVLSIALLYASKVIGDNLLSGKTKVRTNVVGQQSTPFVRYRASIVVRLAIIEAAVLFGGIVYNLSVSASGENGLYLIHFIPAVILLIMAKSLYPTEFVLSEIKRRFEE